MDQKQYRHSLDTASQSVMLQGKIERFVHLVIIAAIFIGAIYFSNNYWPHHS